MNSRVDIRLRTIVITLTAIIIVGGTILLFPSPYDNSLQQPDSNPVINIQDEPAEASSNVLPDIAETLIDPKTDRVGHARQARERIINQHFRRAVIMLHAERYEYALLALHKVLALAPKLPEAHVNMGYTLLGMKRYGEASDFFVTAIELKPEQTNAYYGLAESREALGDIRGAISAMTAFVHLNKNDNDPFIRKAESAIWEWRQIVRESSQQDSTESPPGIADHSIKE